MVRSSLQQKATFAFLILYFMVFHCSSVPLHRNSTDSKPTPENSTVSMDYLQSVSHDVNKHTSHEVEEKQKLYGSKNQTDMTFLKKEEISVMKNVNNILAAENTHGSRSVRRSQRSTHTDISVLIEQYVNHFYNYRANHNKILSKVGFIIQLL
jgi:hypothetical protein